MKKGDMTSIGTVHMAIRRGDELMAPEGAEQSSVKVAKKSDRFGLGMAVFIPYVVATVAVIIVIIVIVNN